MTTRGRTLFMLTGYAGAGKDTVADYLVRAHGFVKFNFATLMKQVVSENCCVELNFFYDREKKDSVLPSTQGMGRFLDKTPRDLLVEFAAKTRAEDCDYWSKLLIKEIEKVQQDKVVIADCRLHSEVDFMRSRVDIFSSVTVAWVDRSCTARVVDNIELTRQDADVVIDNNSATFDPERVFESIKSYL